MDEPAIAVADLRKRYAEVEAVAGIDLQVRRGEVFALLGPNGAGKTTTVEILEGFRQPTAGDVQVLGFDPATGGRAFKERIGIVLQSTGVEPYLTVEETIELFRGYYPAPRPLDELLALTGLSEHRQRRVRRLSGGQQRRLDVACGLAGNPELLFLDEPTTGFDPSARRQAWAMVKGLQALGTTIFLTTHYMDEAEFLADRIAIIVRGRIIAQGSPASLIAAEATTVHFRLPAAAAAPPRELAVLDGDGRYVANTSTPTRTLYALTRWAIEHNVELIELNVARASLEDVYLRLTHEAEDGTRIATPAVTRA